MKHKLFTLLFAIVASTSMMFAESGTCGDYLTWDLTNGVLTISGTGSMKDYSYMSNNLTPWYYSRSSITSVVIGDGVTSIGNYAFYNCDYLSSVNIPNSVTSIGDDVFDRCNNLTSIVIPNSVTSIGSSAFYRTGITEPVYNSYVFAYMPPSYTGTYIIPNGIESIAGAAFSGCSGITSVTIPNSVTSIGHSAFYKCYGLTSVTIPNSITSIESSAFYGCTGLTSITIPDNVTNIKSSAFSGCSNLTSVIWNAKNCPNFSSNSNAPFYNIRTKITSFVLGSEVEYIPSNLCYEMSNLTSVTIPNSVTSIGNYAFNNCSGLTSVTIGNSVASIGSSAFYGCSGLTSVTIPNKVTSIGSSAFHNCSGLTSVTIGSSIASIGSSAFSGCSNLTSVTWNAKKCSNFSYSNAPFYAAPTNITSFVFGDEVEQIPAYLCNGMSNLTSITIPDNVTSIGSSAFYGCTGLTSVTIPNNVTSIGSSAFYNCSGLTSVTIGNSVTNIESSVFSGCNGLTSVTINSNAIVSKKYSSSSSMSSIFGSQVKEYIIGNNVNNIGDYAFYNCSNLESIIIGNSITGIGERAFYGCSGLSSVAIPNSVKNIGNYAFRNCTNLNTITIGNNVTDINEYAFTGCTSLTSIEIPSSVTSIGSNAFNSCTSLTSVHISDIATWCSISFGDIYSNPLYYAHNLYLNDEPINNLVIPAGVTQIGDYLFYGCNGLTSVTIPNSITSIGTNAFSGCTSLTSIEIPNSVTSIGSNAFDGCNIANINYIGTIEDWCNKTWSVSLLSSNYQLRINGELLEHVTIPIQITNVNNTLFSGCNSLISIVIPNTVTNIASNAFSGCTGLTSVVWNATNCNSYNFGNQVESFIFGEEVEVIPASICSGMTNLRSVIIPNGATSIGNSAFYNCSNLKSVNIPNSVASIGNYAFYNCTGLSFVEWDATEYELTKQLFPSVLDTLAVGAHFDTISLTYLPAKEVILRNPMTVVTNIPHAAIKNGYYDKKGTGKMLAIYSDNKNVVIDNLYGMRLDTIGPDINIAQRYSGYLASSWIFCNINNDSVIDARNEGAFYESDNNGGYIPHEYVIPNNGSAPQKYNHIFQLDANLDGLQDFYSYENNKHYFQLRQWDGSYLKTELNVLSDTAAIDSAIYQKWEKVSDEVVFIVSTWDEISLKNHMFIANGDPEDQYSTGFDFIDTAIDLDRNGLVDLLSSSTGAVLYNLGDNTYVKGSFPGSVTPKDLNGDGILDYVIYNKTTKTVSLQIYEGNGNTTTKTLMQNMNISNVWCYDFDNDGDIDILLPFDWTSQSGYAYLVFFRNDGNNTFKKIENAFDDPVRQLEFIDCRDVDNDGSYEIIARETLPVDKYYNDFTDTYYFVRYNNRFKITLENSFATSSHDRYDGIHFIYGDFDQNGINDFYYNTGNKYTLSRFPYTALNTPPAKMSQPRINVDAEKAMLKISWDRGSDAQTSSLDLEYSIRIGSTSGACDMWFAAANANGTQRSLWGANVGAYLSQMVNVSTWKTGDYYIAVQAVDPNGLGGEWSDEMVYHHSLLPYGFNVSDYNITTADTITVQYAGAIDENSTYNWNFGDSAVVLSQNGQTYTIIYTTQGNKTVSLQVISADGRKSPLVTQEVNVLPIRIEKNPNYPNNSTDPFFTLSYFDMDMNGVMDAIGYQTNWSGYQKLQQGIFKGRGDGTFIKLAKTYNSDLSVTGTIGECIFADVNMDGLPDAVVKTSKGNIIYNREDFDAEFSNGTYTLPTAPTPKYDFNNDGRADSYSIKNKHTILLHLNTEAGVETVELYLPTEFQLNELESKYLKAGYDFDNNGYLDFISTVAPGMYAAHHDAFIIYLHDDNSVTCQYIDGNVYTQIYDIDIYPFVDLNSDGVPDLNEYILKSNIANATPSTPTNLRAIQESDGVYLYWDAAKDKETPASQMRYNISVKKQGVAVGTDNAFIVSPMNGLYDEAAIIPGYYYPHGTSYFIPMDKFTGGQTYEFQIQSIDLWNAHSPMSAAYTFTVQPPVLISMPANTCINEPVTVAYTGTNNGAISWNFNGGTASQNSDGTYSVSWSTEGIKTVTATIGGNTSSRVIYVQNAEKDLTFTLPERVLNNSWVDVTLPENYLNLENLAIRASDNCTGYILPKKDSHIFRVRFSGTSSTDSEAGWVEFYQNHPVCGEVNTFRDSTTIVGNGNAPAISLVMVDATTGKNMVTWDAPANLPAYVDSVIVYKEEGKTNNWVKQAKLPVSIGQWIDNASDPSVKSNSYCIAYTSIYGGESPKSKPHKTPHLQTNYGLNGAINLYWTSYEGDVVDSYQIMRGSSASSLQVLAIVAGNECTYTDNSPLEDGYYAIAYSNEAFTEEWISNGGAANAPAHKAMAQARQIRTGQSNIKASAASIQTILATHMTILSMEKTYTLSPSQQILHLYVEIMPFHSTYKQVRWSIVSGLGLATIYSNGLLVANTEGRNGTVRVRATAIDGSGVYAERDITVGGMVVYYTIRFINWNGEVLQSSQVVGGDMPTYNGATPVRAGEGQYVFSFRGWSPDIVIATADADYIAQYDTTAYYTIRFLNWDGTVLQSGLLKEGSIPVYNGESPTREES